MKKINYLCLFMLVMILSGCGAQETYSVDESGKVNYSNATLFTEEEMAELKSSSSSSVKELEECVIEGTTYYKSTDGSVEELDGQKLSDIGIDLTPDKFKWSVTDVKRHIESEKSSEENKSTQVDSVMEPSFFYITVNFPVCITSTNGILDSTKKSVTFDSNQLESYGDFLFARTDGGSEEDESASTVESNVELPKKDNINSYGGSDRENIGGSGNSVVIPNSMPDGQIVNVHKTTGAVKKAVPVPKIQSLKIIKNTSIKVNWTKVKGKKRYVLQVSTSKKFLKKKTKDYTVSATSKTLKNLKPGSTYYFRVRTHNGKWSSVKKIKVKKKRKQLTL